MAKNLFQIVRESDVRKFMDNYYPTDDELWLQLAGLGGELAMRAAACQRNPDNRRDLNECLGNLLTFMEFYTLTDDRRMREIPDYALGALERMRTAFEACRMPDLILGCPDEDY